VVRQLVQARPAGGGEDFFGKSFPDVGNDLSRNPPAPLEGKGVVEERNRGCLLWLGFRRHALPVHVHAYVREKRPDAYAQELYLVHKTW